RGLVGLARGSLPAFQRRVGLSPVLLGRVERRDLRRRHEPMWRGEKRERPYGSALNNALWYELRHRLPEILHVEDALSMAFSVESRTPFLDHRVVELCFSLPFHEKIRDGWTKSLLRRSLADVIPAEILARRRKVGFATPYAAWLQRPDKWRDVKALILYARTTRRGLL